MVKSHWFSSALETWSTLAVLELFFSHWFFSSVVLSLLPLRYLCLLSDSAECGFNQIQSEFHQYSSQLLGTRDKMSRDKEEEERATKKTWSKEQRDAIGAAAELVRTLLWNVLTLRVSEQNWIKYNWGRSGLEIQGKKSSHRLQNQNTSNMRR